VAKSLFAPRDKASSLPKASANGDHVFQGRYVLRGSRVFIVIVYPNSRSTQIRSRLLLRSTTPGANNRLEIESIVSYDKEAGIQSSLLQEDIPDPDSIPDPAAVAAAREHRRGMTCCVLVPWEEVASSMLNLPPSKMDIFIPG
jgi:F-box protein 9